jgi:hypothetical protein
MASPSLLDSSRDEDAVSGKFTQGSERTQTSKFTVPGLGNILALNDDCSGK